MAEERDGVLYVDISEVLGDKSDVELVPVKSNTNYTVDKRHLNTPGKAENKLFKSLKRDSLTTLNSVVKNEKKHDDVVQSKQGLINKPRKKKRMVFRDE